MTFALTAIGTAIIIVTVRDVIHELFHPETSGSMSRFMMHLVWRIVRLVGRRYRTAMYHAGPAMLVAVGAMWTLLLAVGCGLIYLPRLPAAFDINPNLPRDAAHGVTTALYLSMATLTSVGTSDIAPKLASVRFVGVLEPTLGLALISAWITWVLSIYPVIADRRAYARYVDLIRQAQPHAEIAVREPPHEAVADMLRSLTEQTIRITTQLTQLRVTYYFNNQAAELTLAAQLPYALALARAAESSADEMLVRHHGTTLRLAIEALTADIGAQYVGLPHASADRVIQALARDHFIDVPARD